MNKIPLIFLLELAACNPAGNSSNVGGKGCTPLDYTNGVYYFSCTEDKFGNALSTFIAAHPGKHIVSVAGDGTGIHGFDQGYFVVLQ